MVDSSQQTRYNNDNMTELLAQTYLLDHSLAALKAEQGIKSSARVGDRFFSLNYDQIASKAGLMVNQCRGLILGTPGGIPLTAEQVSGDIPVGETVVLARPFDRFFNLGDSNAASVDLNDPETVFYEKLDGTLCIVWFDPITKTWQVATRAVPLADRPMTGWDDLTFRGLFEKALYETLLRNNFICCDVNPSVVFDIWSYGLEEDQTYVFELTTPLNRIVVAYPEYTVWLLGVRDTQTGVEKKLKKAPGTKFAGVPVCPCHSLNNLEELLTFVGSKAPFEQEGVVVRGPNDARVKVKSLAYMAYNRVRDSAANSPRAIMELILTEKLDDVLPVLEPYVQTQAAKIQEGVRVLFQRTDAQYQEITQAISANPSGNPRKDFALAVQASGAWMAPMMDRFTRRSDSLEAYIQNRRGPDGSYPDALLEALLNESAK